MNKSKTAEKFIITSIAKKMKEIADFIEPFRKMWDDRFNKLETIMKKYKTKNKHMEQKTKINAEDGKQD